MMSVVLISPIQPPALERTQIHVWTISLLLESDDVEPYRAILSSDECARADRFQSARDRRRFVVARSLLRRLLAAYLRTKPASIRFAYGTYGKPCLIDGSGLQFNLSHARDVALVALALQREVGVDIEDIDAVPGDADIQGVARAAFSTAEREALAALSMRARRDAFARIWSRKEAFVKARGAGFSYPTQSFSVSHLAMGDDALLADVSELEDVGDWRVADIPAPLGFFAALAASGHDWSARSMRMPNVTTTAVRIDHR
jgi:4'-phosphopantetheinyl transferase